jgi:protein-S-isoprenylcysteine O-methyltransferase Ste14
MPDEMKTAEVKTGSPEKPAAHKPSSYKSWSAVARRSRVPLGFACAVLYFWFARPTRVSLLIGTLTLIPGLLVRALASGHVKKNEELATSGPYAYSRNPLYLGSLILALGFMLAAQSWWVVAILLTMFLAIYLPVIRGEEAFLRERFPGYEAYAERVPRLLPTLRPFTDNQVKFSWDLYRKHREYNALIGAAAMTALLLLKMHWPRK